MYAPESAALVDLDANIKEYLFEYLCAARPRPSVHAQARAAAIGEYNASLMG